jgi:tetratricopeptide (TPR) repeat protein
LDRKSLLERHAGEAFPRAGFVVASRALPSRAMVRFSSKKGAAERWIREGKQTVEMTRLSCRRFRSNPLRLWLSAIVYNFLFFFAPVPCAGHHGFDRPAHEDLGVVSFPTSCQPEVQEEFERGVALLHSFAYSAANASFKQVAEKDPKCAIAHWGSAMTYLHPLWDPSIRRGTFLQGQAEIRRAQEIGGGTDRERGFTRALALFYDGSFDVVPYRERISKYEGAMKKVAAASRDDVESQVFHALALLADASPFDRTHRKQKQAMRILEPLFEKYPEHPGVAHYIIHACDNQEMAQQGLAAARRYSKIAPAAPHALHMPSHIFTRLGMWDDSIASNLAARTAARNQGDTGEELHAMDYLVYAYLQEGRDRAASEVISQLEAMSALDESNFKISYAATAVPVRYAVERRQWTEAARIVPPVGAPPQAIALAVWGRGIGLARGGHPAGARQEAEKLRQLEQQLRSSHEEYGRYWATQTGILEAEVMAWSAQADGEADEARNLLRKAAVEEDSIEKLPVTPGPIVPAREQLGDLLLEQSRPQEALEAFRLALVGAPKRRGSLAGVAQATKALRNGAPLNVSVR